VRWHHVLRQARAEERAQLLHEIDRRILGDEVSNESLVPRDVLTDDDHDLADGRGAVRYQPQSPPLRYESRAA